MSAAISLYDLGLELRRALCLCLIRRLSDRRCLAPRLLVFPCARCQGYTDTLRDGLCLTCKTRPWQNGYYRNPEEVQTWKP